jgi:hypothetical protein
VLTIWPEAEAERLAASLVDQRRRGAIDLANETLRGLAGSMLPGRYDALIVPADDFARLRSAVRRDCAARVGLLLLTPGETPEQPDLDALPGPDILSLAALSPEAIVPYAAQLLAELASGAPLATAAHRAWQSAAPNWPSPVVHPGSAGGSRQPPASPPPQAPDRPAAGNVNFFEPTSIGTFINQPVGRLTISSGPSSGLGQARDPQEQTRLNRLYDFMKTRCSRDELMDVWFRLGYQADDFGPLDKSELARRMVEAVARQGRLVDLTRELARAVPERRDELPAIER